MAAAHDRRVAILIALSVLAPLAYIEGTCVPLRRLPASAAPPVVLPAINELGYQRKQHNTFFNLSRMVHRLFRSRNSAASSTTPSESHFNYLGHIFGFWRSFCTINQVVPPTGESLADVKTMIYVIGISYSTNTRSRGFMKTPSAGCSNGSGVNTHPAGTSRPRDAAGLRFIPLHHPLYKYPFREKLDGLMAISAPTPSPLRTWERDFRARTEYTSRSATPPLIQKHSTPVATTSRATSCSAVATLPPSVCKGAAPETQSAALTPQWQLMQAALQGADGNPAKSAGSGFCLARSPAITTS